MSTCLIIDDEPRARVLLKTLIHEYCPQLEVVADEEDLRAGIKAIKKHQPNLVFLDIEMPGESGLEILDYFHAEEVNFRIIFTTAYSEYALEAFRYSAVDYLLKPIKPEQLTEAVNRFIREKNQHQTIQWNTLKQFLETKQEDAQKRITISTGKALHFLHPHDIVFIKGESAYSNFFLADGNRLLISKNLKHFEEVLAPFPMFFRSHKSYIINVNHAQRYVRSDGGQLYLTGMREALVSPDRIDELLRRLDVRES